MSNLGELLVRENMITPEQLELAYNESKKTGGRLGHNLSKLGYVEEDELTEFMSKKYNVSQIDISQYDIDEETLKLVPAPLVEKYGCLPIKRIGSTLILAMSDPSNINAIDDVKFHTGLEVEMVIAKESLIKKIIGRHYESKISYDQVLEDLDEAGKKDRLDDSKKEDIIVVDEEALEDAPVIRLVNLILMDAIKKGASDIHIEPYEKSYRVRTRIDGVLYDVMQPPLKFKDAISSRIKIMSYLDIAERRLPQDGRIKIKTSRNKEMEFRVSVLPTVFGEKIVLRLLDKSALQVDMTKLGFDIESLEGFQKNIHKPYGMVLVTGPTGSGKTTTLYSALDELNSPEVNISTAEDPVEFTLPGVNQVHVNEEVGLNFAASLRSFLRQDPDIIMVGEIRDFETAEIAIKAALTGHLVLSTLHTNDASSTIHRLLNMGVEPFMVVASVNVVVAQRLARRICPDCKHKTEIPIQSLIELGFEEQDAKKLEYYTGSGCANCSGTGYKGRTGLYEVMPMTDNLRDSVMNGASVGELKQEAIREGMFTIRQSGLKKIKQGFTTIDEVLRVSAAD